MVDVIDCHNIKLKCCLDYIRIMWLNSERVRDRERERGVFYLITLSIARVMRVASILRWLMCESGPENWWNGTDRVKPKHSESLCTTDPTRTGPMIEPEPQCWFRLKLYTCERSCADTQNVFPCDVVITRMLHRSHTYWPMIEPEPQCWFRLKLYTCERSCADTQNVFPCDVVITRMLS